MAYLVDRVVICDAFHEPDKHYKLLGNGRSTLQPGRRPSQRITGTSKQLKGGMAAIAKAAQETLFQDTGLIEEENAAVNLLRVEVREWREAGYPGTATVTRQLLAYWFERDEERQAEQRRLFFCQREAIEAVIYMYEAQQRRRMPETGELVRYALKLATGTGKTIVMAMVITWATLHRARVSGSSLSANFLILVPNLTVRQRVSGEPRGDGLDPAGPENLYRAFDLVPPEYADVFQPQVLVRNWHAIPLETQREDWVPDQTFGEGRFIPASLQWAMQRRRRRDPNAGIRQLLKGWRDVVVINDEAHHAYGEKKAGSGEEPGYMVWSRVIERVGQVARIPIVIDLSATPWYGTASTKPTGMLFEWLISDFSVYDAFESGLVKVVRLPEPDAAGRIYLDLWDLVKGAKTKEEYLSACKGAVANIYASWKEDFADWESKFDVFRDPQPVMLVVASDATRAKWLFEHLTSDYEFLRNEDPDELSTWVTIQVDTKVFDADRGNEAVLREMVSTVAKQGAAGAAVRCVVSVNMLSEGWDVKSVSHIIGLRAFDSPLLTEQIIGRGLRRTDYSVLYEPLDDRGPGSDETVDAFGIPFIGFPVQKSRKRSRTGTVGGTPIPIEPAPKKERYRVIVPNVRAWAVGMSEALEDAVDVKSLPDITIDPKNNPDVWVRPAVGGTPRALLTPEAFRAETPVLLTQMRLAADLLASTTAEDGEVPGIGPTYEELLALAKKYLETRVNLKPEADGRDVGLYFYRQRIHDILANAVRGAGSAGMRTIPMLGDPPNLDTASIRTFRWTGARASGKKCHLTAIACDSPLEAAFADFLDAAPDVLRYVKNERLGFSITYFEANRPRQYYPDFIVVHKLLTGGEAVSLVETKGEMWPNTHLKRQAAEKWCELMTAVGPDHWRYVFVQEVLFEGAIKHASRSLAELEAWIASKQAPPAKTLV
jgi:type III restriction enzyme